MTDITPDLLEKIQSRYKKLVESDPKLNKLRKQMGKGADYTLAHYYASRLSKILSEAYTSVLKADELPDETLYYNIAQRVLEPTLKALHEDVSEVCQSIQQEMNGAAHLSIKAQSAPVNEDRIRGIVNKVSGQKVDDVVWMLKSPVENFGLSVVDDHVQINADFHYRAGMSPKIIRRTDGHCCKWCSERAGVYAYSPDMDRDVFRRHENCGCTVEYDPGDGSRRRQDVWNKKWYDSDAIETRKQIGLRQHKDGDKVSITEQAIEKDHPIKASGYSEENVEFAFQARKELLKFAEDKNNSDECARIIDLSSNTKTACVAEDKLSVNGFADPMIFHLIQTSSEKSLEITHNHPGLSGFSANDINVFMLYGSLKSMTIVTNQGLTMMINKTNRFDLIKAKEAMLASLSKTESKDETIERLLKRCYSFGVERK